MGVTDTVSSSIIRLPLWVGMGQQTVQRVAAAVHGALEVLGQDHATISGSQVT